VQGKAAELIRGGYVSRITPACAGKRLVGHPFFITI